jgi:hypothetical protein
MTVKTHGSSIMLAAEIERIEADLELARSDVALLERLKSATDRVKRLTGEHERATAARTKALSAEAKADEERRYANISNVSVSEGETRNENVVRSQFTIRYSTPTWDGRASRAREHTSEGFGLLPPDVLDYIIEKRPDLIPAKIMALAPDSPRNAFRRYFVSLRRGYVASA